MPYSKIDICNIALASLGSASIRSFDENNKRSRMCSNFYETTKDWVLAKFDWPFARKIAELNQVVITTPIPPGQFVFSLPNDCMSPRDIYPPGGRTWWRVQGKHLYARLSAVTLYYTSKITNTDFFTPTFSNLLALKMAVQMSPAITQDSKLTTALMDQFRVMQQEAWESDANIGNDYRPNDENPRFDTFVSPDLAEYYATLSSAEDAK